MSNNNRWHEIRGEVEGLSTCWFVALCHFALFASCVITNRVLEHYGIQFVADWVEFSLICMTAISGWLALLFYSTVFVRLWHQACLSMFLSMCLEVS